MKNIIFLIAVSIFLISPAALAAEKDEPSTDMVLGEPAIRTTVDKKTISIGDRIIYSIEASADSDTEVEFPKFEANTIGEFAIKGSGGRVKKGLFAKSVFLRWYELTIYTTGKHTIPAIEIKYRKKGDAERSVKKTNEVKVMVESVLPRDGRVSDIKDIKRPLYFWSVNPILIGGLIAILCAAGFLAYKRIKKPAKPKLPHERALEELEKIRGALVRMGDIKEYYIGISDCVRHYVEERFKLRAPEMTTEEFLASLKDSAVLSASHKILMKEFLTACDMVKFAKYAPKKNEIGAVFTSAKNFIDETRERDAHI